MRKLVKTTALICACLVLTSTLSSCYGKFSLTRKLYNWNGSVGNKFVSTGLMWVMMIVPVYSAVGFIDMVALNLIEFWTGSNPLAMEEGQKEVQLVEKEGVQYELTATKNRFDVKNLADNSIVSLNYDPATGNWLALEGDKEIIVANQSSPDAKTVTVFTPQGEIIKCALQ